MSKNKQIDIKDILIINAAVLASWLVSFVIYRAIDPQYSIVMNLFVAALCSLIPIVTSFVCTKLISRKHSDLFFTKPSGFFASLSGSVIAGSMAITLLFDAEMSVNPILTSSVIPMVVHTIFYQGIAPAFACQFFFQGTLRPYLEDQIGSTLSILVTALAYSVLGTLMFYHQMSFILLLSMFAQGLALGAVTKKTGSVWTACIFHALYLALLNNGFFFTGDHFENVLFSWKLKEAGDVITGGNLGMQASMMVIIGMLAVYLFTTLSMSYSTEEPDVIVTKKQRHHKKKEVPVRTIHKEEPEEELEEDIPSVTEVISSVIPEDEIEEVNPARTYQSKHVDPSLTSVISSLVEEEEEKPHGPRHAKVTSMPDLPPLPSNEELHIPRRTISNEEVWLKKQYLNDDETGESR